MGYTKERKSTKKGCMRPSSFINNPDESELHTNDIAHQQPEAARPISFTERNKIERERKMVAGYRHSLLGSRYGARGEVTPFKRKKPADTMDITLDHAPQNRRQQFNAGEDGGASTPPPARRTFQEPPSRGYNPFQ